MADQLKGTILKYVGAEAEKIIFEDISPPKNPIKRAQWVKKVTKNLDENCDEETRKSIMNAVGDNCAAHNEGVVKAAIKKRAKFNSLEDYLDAEIRKPHAGTELERSGEGLILSYLPESINMRCFCALVNSLPKQETLSPTYCNCSVAFVETWWSSVIRKPVKVELLESALTGSKKCRFKIKW
jgi:hypothetical protein